MKPGRVSDAFRDALIELWKTRPKAWAKCSEAEQESLIDRAEFIGDALVELIACIVKADGAEHILVSVDEFAASKSKRTVKFKGAVAVAFLADASAFLSREDGGSYLLTPCEPAKFRG